MKHSVFAKAVFLFFALLLALSLHAQDKKKKIDKETKTNRIQKYPNIILEPQIIPKLPNPEDRKEIVGNAPVIPEEKMVWLQLELNYFGVSEATRNRIDNGDCLRMFGHIFYELDDLSDNNGPSRMFQLYHQDNYTNPSTTAISYYQGDREVAEKEVMRMIDIKVSEKTLQNRQLLLIVTSHLGTRHKDNDFASYDKLVMEEPDIRSFIIDESGFQEITYKLHTDLSNSKRGVDFGDFIIPLGWERNIDDTHNIWVHLTVKKK